MSFHLLRFYANFAANCRGYRVRVVFTNRLLGVDYTLGRRGNGSTGDLREDHRRDGSAVEELVKLALAEGMPASQNIAHRQSSPTGIGLWEVSTGPWR